MTKVLIAEDSTIIQKLLASVLSKDASIQVVGMASNGQEAVDKTVELKPDIILMDYRMPKQNAPEAIKQIMSTQPTPILVITSAEPAEEKKNEVMKLGAVGFMEKPKNMDYNALSIKLVTNVKTLSRLKPAKRSY
jgi:two-component system, chemotaxis family, protein-glutamate methylesterase/glutaminase